MVNNNKKLIKHNVMDKNKLEKLNDLLAIKVLEYLNMDSNNNPEGRILRDEIRMLIETLNVINDALKIVNN